MAVVTGITFSTPEDFTATGKVQLGDAASDSIGFFGASKVSQPRSASQASVAKLTTGGLASPTAVATTLNDLITLCNRVRKDLVALGLIKGSA